MANHTKRIIPVSIGLGSVNAFIVRGDGGAILVDTGFPGTHRLLLRALRRAGLALEDVSLILITHGHVDHFGSAAALRQRCGAPVAIHRADADCMRRCRNAPFRVLSPRGYLLLPFAGRGPLPGARGCEPDMVIDGAMSLEPYGVAGTVLPTPGHTPGSLSLVLEAGADGERVALAGDLLIGLPIWRRHIPTWPLVANDVAAMHWSLRRLMAYSPDIVYSAHGGPFLADAIRASFPWVTDALTEQDRCDPGLSTKGA
ncbi:MAG: MBL fold metallo-hydrolase [Anaerolineae bacterium]